MGNYELTYDIDKIECTEDLTSFVFRIHGTKNRVLDTGEVQFMDILDETVRDEEADQIASQMFTTVINGKEVTASFESFFKFYIATKVMRSRPDWMIPDWVINPAMDVINIVNTGDAIPNNMSGNNINGNIAGE